MTINLTTEREYLRRAYRDLATTEADLVASIQALTSAGWNTAADAQAEALGMVRQTLDEISAYSLTLGREL